MRNAEKKLGYNRKWRSEHKEYHAAYMRERRQNPELWKKEYDRERYLRSSVKFKLSRILSKYNLSKEEYEAKVKSRLGLCAVCFKEMNPPNVDHDHSCCPHGRKTCGKCTRDLLCRNCNTALGLFYESTEILNSAIRYIQKFKQT